MYLYTSAIIYKSVPLQLKVITINQSPFSHNSQCILLTICQTLNNTSLIRSLNTNHINLWLIKKMSLSPPPPTFNPHNREHQVFLTCYFCQLSEEQTHSDILIDTKCHLFNSCYKCYLENKHQNMIQCLCKMKLKDHVKYKNTRKEYILDEAIKVYEKEYKTRLSFDELDPQLVQLMAYSLRHCKPNQYLSRQRQLKTILKDIKKRQNIIFGDLKKLKIPQFVNRQNNDQTGKQACGYESNYEKGMTFLFKSFGI